MTIEIIKKGALPGEKKYRTTCNNCRTEFTFQAKDARRSSDQRDGDALIVKCPLEGCGKDVWAQAGFTSWNDR